MREPIRVFYYPNYLANERTLKKAILFFDEIHFMDRPSFSFGSFGTIGMASPLRQFEAAFRADGVPLYVREQPRVDMGAFTAEIQSDIDDPRFLEAFQEGLRASQTFRDQQIPKADYGAAGDAEALGQSLTTLDLKAALAGRSNPFELFKDDSVRHFDLSTAEGTAKHLISLAVATSARINLALALGSHEGLVPLADAQPYSSLLHGKYGRAGLASKQELVDLSFAAFDRLVPDEALDRLGIKEVIAYRKASQKAREQFLEHLDHIHRKTAGALGGGDYVVELQRLVETDVVPAATTFRDQLASVRDDIFGHLAKGVYGVMGGAGGFTLFGDITYEKVLSLAIAGGGYVGLGLVDAIKGERVARRECAIAYVLDLDR